MLELLIRVVLALAVVGFVGYPLLKNTRGEADEDLLSEEAEELYRRKESTYSAIKELEFDFKTGKLSEQDYQELDAKYRAEAIEILEAIELFEQGEAVSEAPRPKRRVEAEADVDSELGSEAESGVGADRVAVAASGVTAESGSLTALVCGECGRENRVGSKFCATCGSELTALVTTTSGGNGGRADVCVECGDPVHDDHKFCASCGAEVRA